MPRGLDYESRAAREGCGAWQKARVSKPRRHLVRELCSRTRGRRAFLKMAREL